LDYVDMLAIYIVINSDKCLPVSEMLGVGLRWRVKTETLSHGFSELRARPGGSNNDGFLMSLHLETLS